MRNCAICGKSISKSDICNDCFKTYCSNGYPDWVKALIEIESHEQRYVNDKELTFTDLGWDEMCGHVATSLENRETSVSTFVE
jgi:hypothetical protein